jgi:hypothetical protein
MVIHPWQESLSGPWLLDNACLQELDRIVAEQWTQLEAHRKKLIENAVDREKYQMRKLPWYNNLQEVERKEEDKRIKQHIENDPLYADDGCTVTLTLASGTRVVEPSFERAALAQACQGQLVIRADVKLACGGIKVELVVPRLDKGHALSIVVLPEGSVPAWEVFVKLRLWAEDHKPDWLRILNGSVIGVWAIAAMLFIMFCLLALVTQSGSATSVGPSWRTDARDLVNKDIKPDDHGKALTILLRSALDPREPKDVMPVPFWLIAVGVTIFITALLLSYPASTVFEIGSGRGRVRRQKAYAYFLRRSIPAFLIFGVLASFFGTAVFELIRGQ